MLEAVPECPETPETLITSESIARRLWPSITTRTSRGRVRIRPTTTLDFEFCASQERSGRRGVSLTSIPMMIAPRMGVPGVLSLLYFSSGIALVSSTSEGLYVRRLNLRNVPCARLPSKRCGTILSQCDACFGKLICEKCISQEGQVFNTCLLCRAMATSADETFSINGRLGNTIGEQYLPLRPHRLTMSLDVPVLFLSIIRNIIYRLT